LAGRGGGAVVPYFGCVKATWAELVRTHTLTILPLGIYVSLWGEHNKYNKMQIFFSRNSIFYFITNLYLDEEDVRVALDDDIPVKQLSGGTSDASPQDQ
jgi:hypothetical protein